MDEKLSISVFFPAYNDEKTIPKLVEDTISTLEPITDDYEVIIVDDCSPDNVGQVADKLAANNPKIKVVHHEKNKGYGGALKSGFAAATKNYIFYTDGDAQYDPREMKKLLPHRTEYDVVNGYKLKRGDEFYRMVLGKAYNHLARLMFNIKIKDVDCDFRLFKSSVIKNLKLESNEGFICVEMMHKIHKAKHTTKDVGVNHYPRAHGSSQFFNITRVAKTLGKFATEWWNLVVKSK